MGEGEKGKAGMRRSPFLPFPFLPFTGYFLVIVSPAGVTVSLKPFLG